MSVKVGDRIKLLEYVLPIYRNKLGTVSYVKNLTFDVKLDEMPDEIVLHIHDEGQTFKILTQSNTKIGQPTRKDLPLFSGCLMYFPDALLAVAHHSKKGNDKHNPGQPLHWAKDKSKDHADCIARHLIDIGPNWDAIDEETGSYHAQALAWRALALLQILLERKRDDNVRSKE